MFGNIWVKRNAAAAYFKKYWREAAYYCGVLLALGALAWGAELYRGQREMEAGIPVAAIPVQEEVEKAEPVFMQPQGMHVLEKYSAAPRWNAHHGCWQAHPAVDYASEDAAVYAFAQGVVKTIGQSGIYGNFIEVERDGMMLRYCGVLPADGMEVGEDVSLGEQIGTADVSMPSEAHMGAHLHLEVFSGEESADAEAMAENSD